MTEKIDKTPHNELTDLVASLTNDGQDFIHRFTGYIDPRELDVIVSWIHDLSSLQEQWKYDEVKKLSSQLISKMEILENEYAKKITLDESNKPLQQFTNELHTMFNNQRLARHQGLNKISWWSSYEYMIAKLWNQFTSLINILRSRSHGMGSWISSFLYYVWWVSTWGLLIALIGLYSIQQLRLPMLHYNHILISILGLIALSMTYVKNKTWYASIWVTLLCSLIWRWMYQLISINFGL